jgi:hypothetical protein
MSENERYGNDNRGNHNDKVERPHGETGDTVQEAAEVSRPTSDVGRVLDTNEAVRVPPALKSGDAS